MKIYTRTKRRYGLSTSQKHINFFKGGEGKKKGPKTFKTKEAAEGWAKKQGIKKYEILPAKKNKKFKVGVIA